MPSALLVQLRQLHPLDGTFETKRGVSANTEAPLCLYYMLVRVSDLAYYEFLVVTYEHAVLACGFATAQVVKSGVGERFFHSCCSQRHGWQKTGRHLHRRI